MEALAVRVLGPLEVGRDGHVVTISGVRRRALLVRLVVSANEVVPTGRLIDDLWDGDPPPGAASTLQSHVSVLRGLIGSDRIRFVDGGYVLTLIEGESDLGPSGELTQARQNERDGDLKTAAVLLERWLTRWRGAALADVAGAAWTVGEVTRLEELRADAVERLLRIRLGLGDHGAVVADAERAVSEFPLREGFWAVLMLAQYRSGRQSDALRSFGRLRKILGEELGIEPSSELRDLEEAILLQRSELDWSPASVSPVATTTAFPTGIATFAYTEIDGPIALLEQAGDEVFAELLREYHRIVREVTTAVNGAEVSAGEAGFFAVFTDAADALAMARDAQARLAGLAVNGSAPVRVRMAIHTGLAQRVGDTYAGLAVHQVAIICRALHGGQVAATEATRNAAGELPAGMSWRNLGRHRFDGLSEPVEIYQACGPGLEDDFEPILSLGALSHHLPVQVSSFVGRAGEMVVGSKLLAANRLLTVVGPGGAGKTRIALRLAEAQLAHLPDGVWVVELASESDPGRMPALVLKALRLRDESGRTATETLASYLRDRRALLVLDNCEHLVAAAASVVSELLRQCEHLRILATSREPLRVAGESIWQLGPLHLPSVNETELGIIAACDAVALFCERAAATMPDFALDAGNAETVAKLCRRLEGMPLAIELAAAWVRSLPVTHIAERLEGNLDLLSKGTRRGADRHGSLRGALNWSYELLAPSEQTLFRRLAVCVGGFTLGAVEYVCSGEGLRVSEVLDALDGLVDKSLVYLSSDIGGQGRYWMLESVAEYARQRLDASGELTALIERHAEFYSRLARACAAEGATRAACDLLEADHPNLLAALQHLGGGDQSIEHGRLLLDVSKFWDVRGHWRLGEQELGRYLARPDSTATAPHAACLRLYALFAGRLGEYSKSQAGYHEALLAARKAGDRSEEDLDLASLGQVAWLVADYRESGARYDDAIVAARDLGDRDMEGKWLGNRAMVHRALAEYPEARSKYERALDLVREAGDRHSEAVFRGSIGVVAAEMGDYQEALADYDEALDTFREIGDRFYEAGFIGNVGRVRLQLGDLGEARSHFEEALDLARELGDRQMEGCWLGNLGTVDRQLGDNQEAQVRCEDALAIARAVGDRRSQSDWLSELGGIECATGNHAASAVRYAEALEIAQELGRPDDVLLGACSELLVATGRYAEATELLASAAVIVSRTRRRPTASEQSRLEASLAACRARQSQSAFDSAYGRGGANDWALASARALEFLPIG